MTKKRKDFSDNPGINMQASNRYLFLDDYRHPWDAFPITQLAIYLQKRWDIVRNYNQFTRWIVKNGLPAVISFDHDLADEHYQQQKYPEKRTDGGSFKEKTGYDCALWLVEYCTKNQLSCPEFYCHSMNVQGKVRIERLLKEFNNKQD